MCSNIYTVYWADISNQLLADPSCVSIGRFSLGKHFNIILNADTEWRGIFDDIYGLTLRKELQEWWIDVYHQDNPSVFLSSTAYAVNSDCPIEDAPFIVECLELRFAQINALFYAFNF